MPVVQHGQPDRSGVLRPVRDSADAGRPTGIPWSALIFARARGWRLGGVNKALLDVGGSTIVARILAALGPLVGERVLLTNDAALEQLEQVRLVYDARPHAGVLRALAAGLEVAGGDVCLAVACDMPFVSTALFACML